jgi:hypothetical protein
MDFKMNLYSDWIRLTLDEIMRMKKDGFIFDEYEVWKAKQLEVVKKQKQQIQEEGNDPSFLDIENTEDKLKNNYQHSLISRYLDLWYRIIEQRPRKVQYAKTFICPDEHKEALAIVVNEIENGKSLFPRLSRQIFDATQQDGMLFDWGIYHLHLGKTQDAHNAALIQGTKEIVYLMVDDNNAYLLCIDNHGKWTNKDLLKIVKISFPELIDKHKIQGIMSVDNIVSEQEHAKLRKYGVNTVTEIDGDYYFSPGGGINSARGSIHSTRQLQSIIHWLNNAEMLVKEHIPVIIKDNNLSFPDDNTVFNLSMSNIFHDKLVLHDDALGIEIQMPYSNDRRSIDNVLLVIK